MSIDDFFSFRRMVTSKLVQALFWIGLVVVVILGLVSLGRNALLGLGLLVVGPLIVRIYCEFLIIFFRVNETLTDILHTLQRSAVTTSGPDAVSSSSIRNTGRSSGAGWSGVGARNEPTSVRLSPTAGPQGVTVQASLAGFYPGSLIFVRWANGDLLGQVNAWQTGNASLQIVVPPSGRGTYTIEATTSDGRRASTMFEVTEPTSAGV